MHTSLWAALWAALWVGLGLLLFGLVFWEAFRTIAIPYLFWLSPLLVIFLNKRGMSEQIQTGLTFLYWILLILLPIVHFTQLERAAEQVDLGAFLYYYFVLSPFIVLVSFPVFFFFSCNRHWFDQAFLYLLILLHAVAFLLINASYASEDRIKYLVLAQIAQLLFGDFIQSCSQSEACDLGETGSLLWFAMAGLHLVYILICLFRCRFSQPRQL